MAWHSLYSGISSFIDQTKNLTIKTMDLILYSALFLALFFHLVFELYAVYTKYSLSAIDKAMLGHAASNIIALISRGFLAVYGIIVSFLIESSRITYHNYIIIAILSYTFATLLAFYLQQYNLGDENKLVKIKNMRRTLILVFSRYSKNESKFKKMIDYKIYPFIGLQFLVIVLAYAAAIKYPGNRLTFVAAVPLFTMVGSLISVAYVDSKYAILTQNDTFKIQSILKESIIQRCAAFSFSAIILIVLLCITF
jgi:hypothetical protein